MRTPRHRLVDSADTKEKCSLLFGFARDQFLLKRKGHFSLMFCPPSIRAGGGATILSARAWRNSPHTPLPPCPRSDGRIFRRRLIIFYSKFLLLFVFQLLAIVFYHLHHYQYRASVFQTLLPIA